MKTAQEILSKVKLTLLSSQFIEKHKIRLEHFSRKRVLTFTILLIFILNGIKKSIQVQLNHFTDIASLPQVSKQAFSEARKKISPEAIVDLNDVLVREYYTNNNFIKHFGYILVAIDGSTIQLPDSHEIKNKYGAATNGNTEKEMCMGRTAHIYDVLNGITLSAFLEPYKVSEKEISYKLIKYLSSFKTTCKLEKILLLLDRGYPCLKVLAAAVASGVDVLARCKINLFSVIKKMIKKKQKDRLFAFEDLWNKIKGRHRRDLLKHGLDISVLKDRFFRILVIDLPTGEKEVLITTLTDQNAFKYECFSSLYFKRWGVEEDLKFKKVRLEIENFSGLSSIAVSQDFHSTVFAMNALALLVNESQEEVEKETHSLNRQKKYDYKINKNVAMGAFTDQIIHLMSDPQSDIEAFCIKIKAIIKPSVVPIRPGRTYPRKRKNTRRKFHMNRRRCL